MSLSKTVVLPIVVMAISKFFEPEVVSQLEMISPEFYEGLTYALMVLGAALGRYLAGGVWIFSRKELDR